MAAPLVACDDDDDDGYLWRARRDSGAQDATTGPGVCRLSDCPRPEMGVKCCTPDAECGMDPTGVGLACVLNPDVDSNRVCVLDACPTPVVGNACCTPFAQCGFDPFGIGQACFAFPPSINVDAGVPPETCDATECPDPEAGGFGCCLPNGECGFDPFGINVCFAPQDQLPPADDAGLELPPLRPLPPISTQPPDDPSVTGECPSFLGFFGPVWGCCSDFGVCGTFAAGECLLPLGTQLPVSQPDEDAGMSTAYPLCTPPAAD